MYYHPAAMPLVAIPPYVLAGESPPHHRGSLRAFHLRSWEVPPPVAFPREVFAEALAEHARLVEEHGADVLDAPLVGGDEPEYFDMGEIGLACALLVADGPAREIHKWRRQEISYVVQRCRGIVRQLMAATEDDRMYLVVVARGTASLQLVRGHAPRRVGERPRLEVVGRDLVVEPWEQWHWRDRGALFTAWWTPAGDAVVSRVAAPRPPRTIGGIVDALVALYGANLRERLAAHRAGHRGAVAVAYMCTDLAGEEISILSPRELECRIAGCPRILEEARKARPGLAPVVVDAYCWAALAWIAVDRADVALPRTDYEWNEGAGPCPAAPVSELCHRSHRIRPGRGAAPARDQSRAAHRREWIERLSTRLARLVRLVDLQAPDPIVENERALVRKAIAELDAGDAQAVLRAWPRAARLLERGAAASSKRGPERPS